MLLSRFLRRRGRARLRRIMRGYRRRKEAGELDKWVAVREAMTNVRIERVRGAASRLLFGAGIASAELIVRQYLLTRVMGLADLNRALLYAIGNGRSQLVYPLPKEWRLSLRQHGYGVSGLGCAIAWQAYVLALFAYGIFAIGRHVLQSLRACIAGSQPPGRRYIAFAGLTAGSLPQPDGRGRSDDIMTWYARWSGRVDDIDALCHTVPNATRSVAEGIAVVSAPSVPALGNVAALLKFLAWSTAAATLVLVDMLRGRWWHALMLSEASTAAVVRLHPPSVLAREYLFHNSGAIHRPLWTYDAEAAKSLITMYFYSTNCERFKRPDGYAIQGGSWQVMNWPRYLVWDDYQAAFVRRAVGTDAQIQIVGPIAFQTTAIEMPPLPEGCVAVFDIQPHRESRYRVLGAPEEYYTATVACQFLIDVHQVVSERGASMALKRKRHIGRLLHPKYRRVVDRLSALPDFITIDPATSALRVIEEAAAVISMPFTSTAILAVQYEKPSIYYDPSGMVAKDDRAAHGIPVLSGLDELREWFARIDRSPQQEIVGARHPRIQAL